MKIDDVPCGTLTVSVHCPYGRSTLVPECKLSRLFAELLGQKTLTAQNIILIKALGFEVVTKEVKEVKL